MKRFWLAFAAAVGLVVMTGESRADFGGPPPVMNAGGVPGPQAPENTADRFGMHPFFRQVVWWRKAPATAACPPAPRAYAPPMAMPYPGYGPAQPQGTLVFPNHQFSRSPRDFFMWER